VSDLLNHCFEEFKEMTDVTSTIKNKLEQANEASKQAIDSAKEKAGSTAGYVADRSKQVAAAASEALSSASSYLGKQAENATDALSGGLKSVAQSIRQNAPGEGSLGGTASEVAQTFSNAAGYLDREGLDGIQRDFTALIKNNPLPALLMGIGLGFLLGRASSSRS
jgi:hypothetical protein